VSFHKEYSRCLCQFGAHALRDFDTKLVLRTLLNLVQLVHQLNKTVVISAGQQESSRLVVPVIILYGVVSIPSIV
jgi:hypothetical protein